MPNQELIELICLMTTNRSPGKETQMKIIRYLNIFVFPFVIMIIGSYFLQQLIHEISPRLLRSSIYSGFGLLICIGIFFLISRSLYKLSMKPMLIGGLSSLLYGLLIGLAVSFFSGIGFGLVKGYSFNFANLLLEFHLKLLGNSFPALCEEIIFRGGIVEGTMQLFGKWVGLAAGSITFGVLHVVGIFFGNSVTVSQILGISLAGLMLSLVYLRFGILGSFACHLMWNSLVSGWIKVYGITDKDAVSTLEGSWVTCFVLATACLMLHLNLTRVHRRSIFAKDPIL